MSERGPSSILFTVGIGLIIAGAVIYGVLAMLGISFAAGEVSEETGVSLFAMFALPGLIFLGLVLLFIKVVLDRVFNKEDSHYSRTVDK